MTVVLVTIPSRWASKMPRLTPPVRLKSSALTMRNGGTDYPYLPTEIEARPGCRAPRRQDSTHIQRSGVLSRPRAIRGNDCSPGQDARLQADTAQPFQCSFHPEKPEEAEHQSALGLEIFRGLWDNPIHDNPAMRGSWREKELTEAMEP